MAGINATGRLRDFSVNVNGIHRTTTAFVNDCVQETREIQKRYQDLLVKYHALQREHVALKSVTKEQHLAFITDPYVMVLINAHTHKFREAMLAQGAAGGIKAARVLNEVVKHHLAESCYYAEECRIVVRIYAGLEDLAAEAASGKRLARFGAAFSSGEPFFDFVDVGDEKLVMSKIIEMFNISVHDVQCRQILLGTRDDPMYITDLEIHLRSYNKVGFIGIADECAPDTNIVTTGFWRVFTGSFEPSTPDPQRSSDPYTPNNERDTCLNYGQDLDPEENLKLTHSDRSLLYVSAPRPKKANKIS